MLCLQAAEGSLASMNGVHAALQFHVSEACFIQGTRDYKLAEQADYKSAYQLYCKKSAARSSSQDGSVHLSMTADDLTNMCHKLLASDDKDDMRNLAMILYQFSTVSRGDDVRPRKLSELMVRYLNGVGECQSAVRPGCKALMFMAAVCASRNCRSCALALQCVRGVVSESAVRSGRGTW
jgi:hypothetical protein